MQSVEEQSASNANLLSFKASDVLLIHYLSSFHGFVPIKSVNVAHTEDMDDVMIGARVICWDREGTVASGYGMFACCLYCERDVRNAYASMPRCCILVDMYILRMFCI